MTVRLLAFTQKGMELARRLAAELSGEAARCGEGCTLDAWTADAFANADALVYVGAAGIAVRAVAPYAGNKAWTRPWWRWTNAAASRCRC